MSEVLLVAIFAGATKGTTSTVLEAPPASPTSGGQCTHPYESRLHPPRPAGPGPTSYPMASQSAVHLAGRRDSSTRSCRSATAKVGYPDRDRDPRWGLRPTQVGSDQADWIRRNGSSLAGAYKHDHHAARSIQTLFPSSGSLPNTGHRLFRKRASVGLTAPMQPARGAHADAVSPSPTLGVVLVRPTRDAARTSSSGATSCSPARRSTACCTCDQDGRRTRSGPAAS
jgi:hypothetical protein